MHIISLYDMTGNMVRPWAEAGYDCYCFDIQNTNTAEITKGGGIINFLWANLRDCKYHNVIASLAPSIIFSFTPCDDMSVAGSKHFAKKAAANPNYEQEALELAMVAPSLANRLLVPYMVENPVSRLSSLWRKPNYYFDPYEYGGYLPEHDSHPTWPEYLPPRDAYPKKTCIWSGNGFVMPFKKPVEIINPEDGYPGWKKLGGKSQRTKNIRSATPRGFANAVFLANRHFMD